MIKPILFNTEMVQAILEGRKTVTRRIVRQSVYENFVYESGKVVNYLDKKRNILESPLYKAPYQPGDILYVRETWAFIPCICCNGEYARGMQPCYDFQAVEFDDGESISDGCFVYRADCKTPEHITWRPSIHMPKEATRIWLKVTDVRVERLQDITGQEILAEGISNRHSNPTMGKRWENCQRVEFEKLWDSTIKQADKWRYSWSADPWVWVIEFEKCKKPDGCNC